MTAEFWTAQLRIVEGEASEESPEIAFTERYDGEHRRAGLYILAEPGRPGSERFIGEMVTRIGEDFLSTEGSLTGSLQRVLRDRHAELRDWNRRNLPKDQASYGVSCLVLRNDASFLCQLGPSLALVRQGSTLARHEPREKSAGRPLGLAEVASPEFQRMELGADGYALLISSAADAVLSEAVRERLQETAPDEVLAFLYPFLITLPSVSALVVAPLPAVARFAPEAGEAGGTHEEPVPRVAAAMGVAGAAAAASEDAGADEAFEPTEAEALPADLPEPERTTPQPLPTAAQERPSVGAGAEPGLASGPSRRETAGYGLGGGGLGEGRLGGGGGLGGTSRSASGGSRGASRSVPAAPASPPPPGTPAEAEETARQAVPASPTARRSRFGFVGALTGSVRRVLGSETRDPWDDPWEAVEPAADQPAAAAAAAGREEAPQSGGASAGSAGDVRGGDAPAARAASTAPERIEQIERGSLVPPPFEPSKLPLPESMAEPLPALEVGQPLLKGDSSSESEAAAPAPRNAGPSGPQEAASADAHSEEEPAAAREEGPGSDDLEGDAADGKWEEGDGGYGLGSAGGAGQGRPAGGRSTERRSTEGRSTEGQSTEGRSTEGQSTEGKSTEGQSTGVRPNDGRKRTGNDQSATLRILRWAARDRTGAAPTRARGEARLPRPTRPNRSIPSGRRAGLRPREATPPRGRTCWRPGIRRRLWGRASGQASGPASDQGSARRSGQPSGPAPSPAGGWERGVS